jgi:hypothetical protein
VITETKPLSARKRFMLVKVVERAPIRHTTEVDDKVVEAVLGTKEEKPAAPKTAPKKKAIEKVAETAEEKAK